MRIYYSGGENLATPEVVLSDRSNVMLTYNDFHHNKKPDKRFRKIIKARKKKVQK